MATARDPAPPLAGALIPFGGYAHAEPVRLRVTDTFVSAVPGLPTPVTFGEILPPDHLPIWLYRCPKASDLEIQAEERPIEAIRLARLPGVTAAGIRRAPPSRAAGRSPAVGEPVPELVTAVG